MDIRTYRVIYRAIEDVRDALVGLLEPDIVEDVIGQLEVRATFRASRIGTIAGCYVTEGVVRRNAQCASSARAPSSTRAASPRSSGSTRTPARSRPASSAVVLIEDYNDVKEGDQLEAFELREVARTAQVAAPAAPAPPAAPAAAE